MAFRGGGGGRLGGMARPENALKRAEELENVGQQLQALNSLHEVVTSRKHRTWSKVFEDIMMKLMDLCVDLKKRNQAKEALMQYRNMCQAVNINSLEEVVKHFLRRATERAEEARQQAETKALEAVEDLDDDASPEDLMLSYVSGDKSRDRTDRELVTPWFRFLWESYRSVLEILRTNPKLEALYASTACRAFGFCLQYKRTSEFRRLCDILRQHLSNMARYHQRDQRDLTAPESLALFLETRFEQLKTACELEMWAEAFRSVEDIQQLIALGKRQPKQQLMALYYAKLTQVFAKSGAQLFHAYAWLKLLNFSRSYNKNLSAGDTAMMATSVVLAALAVPPYERPPFNRTDELSHEQERERTLRMASILGFAVDKRTDHRAVLTRGALVAQINALNLLALVPAEVRAAYELMTAEFNPLDLCAQLDPLLASLAELSSPMSAASPVRDLAMAEYLPAIKRAAVLRALKQLGDVYSALRIGELQRLVPFMPFGEVEALVVDAVRHGYLQLRVDHRAGTLHFGGTQLESDRVRGQLSQLAKRLSKAAALVDPSAPPAAEAQRRAALQLCRDHVEKEHSRLLARKAVIEKRKEQAEAQAMEAEREEQLKRQQAAREQEALEAARRREEAARREKERLERELEEREEEEARQLLEQQALKAGKGSKGASKVAAMMASGEKVDRKALMQDVLSERLKEAQELERKLTRLAKTMDHMERARREAEAPLLEEAYAARAKEDASYHAEQQQQAAEAHRLAWGVDVEEKKRLSRMAEEKDGFAAAIIARRQEEFEALKKARARRLAERRAAKKVEREIARRKEWVKRCREEVRARVEELKQAQKEAEEERRRAEQEDMRRRAEEAAAKQRAKEEEVERKLREEKAAALAGRSLGGGGAPAAAAAAGGGGGGGGNRFVPPALRRQMEGGGGGGGGGAPAAAAAGGGDREWRSERPAPAAAAGPPAPAAEREDRWGRRDGPPPAPSGGAGAGGGGGGYVPRFRRDEGAAPAAAPPPARPDDREREQPTADAGAPPARSGGGSGYVPPSRRQAGGDAGGGGGGGGGGSRW